MHRAVVVDRIDEGGIDLVGEFEATSRLAVDGVVLVTQRLSDEALYRELAGDPAALEAAGIEAVYRIGDCVAPRLIADAIFDGHRLAREIDSPDPERAAALPARAAADGGNAGRLTRHGPVTISQRPGRPGRPQSPKRRPLQRRGVAVANVTGL